MGKDLVRCGWEMEGHQALVRLAKDVTAIRRQAEEDRPADPYSEKHEPGSLEVGPDLAFLEEVASTTSRDVSSILEEMRGLGAGISLAARNSNALPRMELSLDGMARVQKWGLGAFIVNGVLGFLQRGVLLSKVEAVHRTTSDLAVSAATVADNSTLLVSGQAAMLESDRDTRVVIARGFMALEKRLRSTEVGLEELGDRLVFALEETGLAIAQVVGGGLEVIRLAFDEAEEARVADAERQRKTMLFIEENAERRHAELMSAVRSPQAILANECYEFALQNFKVSSFSAALKEVRKALEASSTHIPSLILMGRLAEHYAVWPDAKDYYDKAMRLAKEQGGLSFYGEAMGRLVQLEMLLGNDGQAAELTSDVFHDFWEVDDNFDLLLSSFKLDKEVSLRLIRHILNFDFYVLSNGERAEMLIPIPPDVDEDDAFEEYLGSVSQPKVPVQIANELVLEEDFASLLMQVYELTYGVVALYRRLDYCGDEFHEEAAANEVQYFGHFLFPVYEVLSALAETNSVRKQRALTEELREALGEAKSDFIKTTSRVFSEDPSLREGCHPDIERAWAMSLGDELMEAECLPVIERLKRVWPFSFWEEGDEEGGDEQDGWGFEETLLYSWGQKT
jgi:hypothetical protein